MPVACIELEEGEQLDYEWDRIHFQKKSGVRQVSDKSYYPISSMGYLSGWLRRDWTLSGPLQSFDLALSFTA